MFTIRYEPLNPQGEDINAVYRGLYEAFGKSPILRGDFSEYVQSGDDCSDYRIHIYDRDGVPNPLSPDTFRTADITVKTEATKLWLLVNAPSGYTILQED